MAGQRAMWAAAAAVAAAATGLVSTEAGALMPSQEPVERHCVVEVVGEADGVLTTGPERCYATFDEAQEHGGSGQQGLSTGATRGRADTAFASASSTIGVHFTGTNYTGSSITITGSVCSGGVWYLTGSWNNNIASSYHYCGASATRFYDSASCSGTSYAIFAAASTLGSMNDRASCVRYG